MAAVEVYKYAYPIANYNYMNSETFRLAQMFSQSNHFDIIDSYSHKLGLRWKGDPIADGKWTSGGDLDEQQDWFIVECKTLNPALASLGYTGLPKWQAKFQFSGGIVYGPYYPFKDVSDPTGVKYPKNHNASSIECVRLAPYGGWDFEDSLPDFNPSSPPASGHVSTQNHRSVSATATPVSSVVIMADGVFIRIAFYNGYNNQFTIYVVANILGDVTPLSKDFMPMPRASYANGVGNGNICGWVSVPTDYFGENGNQTNNGDNYATTESPDGGIAFWDENEELVESGYISAAGYTLNYGMSNFYSDIPGIDSVPFIPIPYKTQQHPYFMYPYVRKAWMPGIMPVNNKQWLAVGHGWGPLFIWDGTTVDPY